MRRGLRGGADFRRREGKKGKMAAERAERWFEAQRAQTKLNYGEEKEKKELLVAGPNEMLGM